MRFFYIGLVVAFCVASSARAEGNYPVGMDYPERAVTMRSSSHECEDWQNGNMDARIFDPGQTRVLAELEGPGRITHIWFTSTGTERGYPRSAVIRMYWDGSEEPAVEVPLGDFFAVGHGMQADVNSSMVANSSFGRANNCYWPMPFRKSARVTLTNESETDLMGLYWYVDWEKRAVPEDVPYFHAQYRQENPPKQGEDYLIADIKGKGHFVGTVLSVRASQPGWFGEGDDRFYVDGDTIPTIHGTGTEDYFNDAWAFRVVNRPNYGVSIWEGMNTGGRICAYRWHVTDPVFFETSLKFAIEHKGNTFYEDGTLVDAYTDRRPDFYSSVAFWYQTGKAKRFEELPPAKERMAAYALMPADELLEDTVPEMTALVKDPSPYFDRTDAHFVPGKEGDSLTVPFEVAEAGNYLVFARVIPGGDSGTYDFYLNGQLLAKGEDLLKEHSALIDVKLGNMHHLEKGSHSLKAVYRGTSKPEMSGRLVFSSVVLEPVGDFEQKED